MKNLSRSILLIFIGFYYLIAQIMGSNVPDVVDDIEKANQSQVIWYDDSWWGIFRSSSTNLWSVYKYANSNWQLNGATGISGVQKADAHVNESTGKLYIVVCKGTEQFSRISYSSGTWVEDSGFPVFVNLENILGNDPASIAQGSDGDLFIFYASDNSLKGLYSSDDGQNWTNFTITSSLDNSSLTDAIDFQYDGQGQIGIFVGQGDSNKKFLFYRLPDNLAPTNPSNWIEENLPINPVADDHVNIIKDLNNNLYMIGKTGTGTPIFYLFKRSNTGTWSYYEVNGVNSTRPALAINEDTDELIIVARNNGRIEFVKLNKNSLSNVSTSDWQPILKNGAEVFNNPTVSYQILSNQSDVLVCAENVDRTEIWYNFIYAQDVSLPVYLSSFSVSRDQQSIQFNWSTESEVDNAFFQFQRSIDSINFHSVGIIPGMGNSSQRTDYNFNDDQISPDLTYFYRMYDVSYNGKRTLLKEVKIKPSSIIHNFELLQNYPNPFNSETSIRFLIDSKDDFPTEGIFTDLSIFNIRGQKVKTVVHGKLKPGRYDYKVNSEGLNSGVYIYRLQSRGFVETKRMVILK